MKQPQQLTSIITAFALAALLPAVASAQTRIWNGGGDGVSWNSDANWGGTAGAVPDTTGETADFRNTGVGTVNLNIPGITAIGALVNGAAFSGTWTLDLNGNTLTTAAATGERFNIGFNLASDTFNITNGTFTTQGGTIRLGVRSGGLGLASATVNISAALGSSTATAYQIGSTFAGSPAVATVTYTGTGSFAVNAGAGNTLLIGTSIGTSSGNATANLTVGPTISNFSLSGSGGIRIGTADGASSATATVSFVSSASNTLVTNTTATIFFGSRSGSSSLGKTDVTVDFSGSPNARISTTSGNIEIGNGNNANASVTLGSGGLITTATGQILVGDDNTGNNAGGSGLLTLNSANLRVTSTGSLTVRDSGQVVANIAGFSSGITLDRNNAAALNLLDFNPGEVRLTLNFADPNFTPSPTNPYWGMRWLGNWVTTLSNFVNEAGSGFTGGDGRIDVNIVGGSNLQWSDFNIGTYVDGANTYTYIGFINFDAPLVLVPEPSTMFLLLVGGGLFYRRWGRNAK